MHKKTFIKLGAFVASAAATAALVGFAANGTGAYFSDSHSAEIDVTTGHVKVVVTPGDGGALSFTNVIPGEYTTQNINYTADTSDSSGEDVWFVITPPGTNADTNCLNDTAEALNGAPDDNCGGGLGRYGHFAITSTASPDAGGASFTSFNLSTTGTTGTHVGPSCPAGGSNQVAANKSDFSVPFCPVPTAILLASGLTNANSGTATVTFGYTPLLTSPQSTGPFKVANYKIVATQHGVSPTDPNN